MDLPVIHSTDLTKLLPMEAAIDALERAFGAARLPETPQRAHLDVGSGDLLLMPAWSESAVGVKLVTVNQSNPTAGLPLINGVYVLFSHGTLQPLAIFDAAALTGMRTAAVSGLATRHLSRSDTRRLVIFGAGTQARHHLESMLAVRAFNEVVCVSRTRWRTEEFAQHVATFGIDGTVGVPDDVARADVVCTCTTSSKPVFDGSKLKPGTHVNAVGAYKPTTRELDDHAIGRGPLVVETRKAALAEAGDLLIPMKLGVIDESAIVADLAEVVAGKLVRHEPSDITIFKSVGVAFEDLAVAQAAYDRL
ncbi:MAG TPA: ornithine cyclodeaminase family protein [Actinomycetota bacterium]|nr:ornithine cyclodeaminase family protein [Actinomycetota bacterium]